MSKTITNFFSNKYNLFGMIALCNIIIGYIIGQYLTIGQLWLVFILLCISNFCMITYGMAQGMLMMGIAQTAFKKFMDNIEKEKKKNDTK